ncbi:MAG: TRAP transporter small permease subunit [Chromatiales bacterium]|jgi:TRAP-type C4-dicarboxylate transport system permease small subunit|nr:MAG: TRAP transporter small permease subunit [Chromatiales bacterium]
MNGPGPRPLLRLLDRLTASFAMVNEPVARVGRDLAASLIGAMVVLALAQILSRALFSYTLDWAEELARVALVWSVLLVSPFAYRSGAHVAIGSFAAALPPRLLLAASAVLNVLVLWICVEMLIQSVSFWARGLALTASALGIQMAWIYAIVPVAFVCLLLVGIELVLRLLRSLLSPDPDLTLVGAVPGVKPDGG